MQAGPELFLLVTAVTVTDRHKPYIILSVTACRNSPFPKCCPQQVLGRLRCIYQALPAVRTEGLLSFTCCSYLLKPPSKNPSCFPIHLHDGQRMRLGLISYVVGGWFKYQTRPNFQTGVQLEFSLKNIQPCKWVK